MVVVTSFSGLSIAVDLSRAVATPICVVVATISSGYNICVDISGLTFFFIFFLVFLLINTGRLSHFNKDSQFIIILIENSKDNMRIRHM